MKNILFTLFFLILILSCRNIHKKKISDIEKVKNSDSLKISPKTFIPEIPDKLRESSGLIYYDNLFWTHNNSGGENRIYGLDRSGKIKEIEIINAKNVDWEDLAQDEKPFTLRFRGSLKTCIEMDSVFKAQTNGICDLNNDSLLISCEQTPEFIQQYFYSI